MQILKDCKGREWEIVLNLATAEWIEGYDFSDILKDEEGEPRKSINFVDPDETLFTELWGDTTFILTVIWILIHRQAEERKITIDDFKSGLDGDTITKVKEAFWEETINFFPIWRTTLSSMRTGMKKIQAKISQEKGPKLIKQATEEFLKKLDELDEEIPGKKSTTLPPSSKSITG